MSEIYDITIIGGGPVGLFTAFYAGLRQAKTKIIESLPVLGGQVAMLYPEKNIYDIAAFPEIKGQDLVDALIKQLDRFDPTICLEESVLDYEKEDGLFKITTDKGQHLSRVIIIAAGAGAFEPRTLSLENADQFRQANLHYLVSNLDFYRDQEVIICGGGDTAVDWALALEKIAKKVTLVHRRNKFRAHEYSVQQVRDSSVEILTPYSPHALHGQGKTLEAVTFKKAREDELITLPVDYFIVNYGYISSLGPLEDWGLEMTPLQKIKVNSKLETNIPGVYAVGDVVDYDSKIELIQTGFAEGPMAVSQAVHYINPNEQIQPQQSTSLDLD